MERWEYLVLVGDLAGGDRLRVRWRNGVEVQNWKQGPLLHDHLNQTGEEGWELVTVDLLLTRHPNMIFKSRKQ